MANSSVQRTYTAPCPGCGAPVAFRGAQSTHAVCSYCQSTVVRDGETLSRIGKMAELFDDHSPLQLMARGSWNQRAFTLVGRLQYRSASGTWTEWIALFDDGSEALLAEDNGAYVMALPVQAPKAVPAREQLRLGATTAIGGKPYTVSAHEEAALVAAQGELPRLPPLNAPFAVVELRSADNEVVSIDYSAAPPTLSKGRPVLLDTLDLTGLKDDADKVVAGRQFACPHCGAQIEVKLAGSKSITCRSCHSLIDLTQGLGGELAHAVQHEPMQPVIPLGSSGQLEGAAWQVVGFQHRLGTEPDDPDEHFGWDEYLLYNRKRGFIFLVDTTEGWSIVKAATGAPALSQDMKTARYLGASYQLQYAYQARTTYVAGEFYWPVERGHASFNRDYAKGRSLLSLEETPRERTWSVGHKVESATIANAFDAQVRSRIVGRGDAGPTSGRSGGGAGCLTMVFILFAILLLIALVRACDAGSSGGSGLRSGGGSWSGGGSHK